MAVLTLVLGLPVQMAIQMAIADRTLAQSPPNRQEQADQLVQYASQLLRGSRYDEAVKTYEQALQIYQELKDRSAESVVLNNIGLTYFRQKQYPKALAFYQQSLTINKQIGDRKGEATSLSNIGAVYNSLRQYDQAISFFQQSLTIRQQIGDRKGEATSLSNLGNGYLNLKQHQQAADFFQKAVTAYQQIGDRNSESLNLGNLGTAYQRFGQYQKAATAYQQALAIFKQMGNLENQSYSLKDLGDVYRSLGQYSQSINAYTEALAIARQTQDVESQKNLLNDLGTAQVIVGDYKKAIASYQSSLALAKKLGDSNGLGNSLIGIGNGYNSLAQYQKAIDFYQQALVLKRQDGDLQSEAKLLGNLANTYDYLGNLPKAIEFNLQSIELFKKIGDREGLGKSLNNLGSAYSSIGNYPKAIETHQQSLAISKQLSYLGGEATSLNNLGIIYSNSGQLPKAIEFYQQALAINRTTGDRNGEGLVLGNLGNAYSKLQQYDQAYNFFQQTLSIFKQNGDREKESLSFSQLGSTLSRLNQPELAILFYKQSINVRESIRKDIRGLSKEDQTTYLETIANSYKNLADLLLKQGRIMEALQVLDLLKVQELEDYLKNIKGSDRTAQGIRVLAAEKALIPQLSKISFENSKDLNSQLASQIQQLPKAELNQVPEYLRQIPQSTVLLYPLILGDRLEIILFSPNALPISRAVNLSQAKLESLVTNFKGDLIDAGSEDYQENAISLYNLLIKPIESELTQTKATTILYAPDGILRYVPLAALYDGKQWLIEKYRISNLIAYSLSDFSPKPKIQPSILAGAFGGKAGEKKFGQQGLPATIKEVQAIANAFQNSTTLLESDFSRQITESKFKNYNILHFATHAEFNIGTPDNSFIIFGNGDKIRLNEITDWQIPNIELIVLSACQTGVGKLGSGVEILGFGYQVQKAGAKSAIASLWSVDDEATQSLMTAFYKELRQGDINTSAALQKAQVSLIKSANFKHPKYWSAFFAIGNGM
ncbi:tetratricopeptide repeat protein [Pseudanabaena sp. FACHB-1998]|uniref:CHAT domain-containing protein n=1 Tax=Pseudanabaena sp. FACHB-1998 TaxID=2692858 RepID=UPI0016815164|nr:tetratricopeptide repeat protein [Pseudanabaena sp. FACHB-1998]